LQEKADILEQDNGNLCMENEKLRNGLNQVIGKYLKLNRNHIRVVEEQRDQQEAVDRKIQDLQEYIAILENESQTFREHTQRKRLHA
jgi:septum formation topological specificity factor MinE